MKNSDVVILAARRSPFGRFQGGLKDCSPPQLFAPLVRRMLIDAKGGEAMIPEVAVHRLILGNVYSAGEGQHIVRQAARVAELSERCKTHRTERACTASLQALWDAYLFAEKYDELVIAGGMDSMSRTPYLANRPGKAQGDRFFTHLFPHSKVTQTLINDVRMTDSMLHDGLYDGWLSGRPHMAKIADEFAKANRIERKAQDEYAFRSFCRAYNAKIIGVSGLGIVHNYPIASDEGIREPNLEKMRGLPAVFGETITAANASQLSDGASAVLLTTGQRAKKLKSKPMARIIAFGDYATGNEMYLAAPVNATEAVLKNAGMKSSQIDLLEVHEPFAVGALYYRKCLAYKFGGVEAMDAKMNLWGGSIAVGHPLGATGGRLVVNLVHQLRYYHKHYGLAVACNGGGEAVAVIIENLQR